MQEDNETDYEIKSKARLLKICSKKITTSAISALAAIEEHVLTNPRFASLAEELEIIYETKIRNHILDTANRQIRNMSEEFSQNRIEWKKYNIKFDVKEKDV